MKTGKTLQELAAEITRQSKAKQDFVADTRSVTAVPREKGLAVALNSHGEFEVGDVAHDQIAEHVKIPAPYYRRMRDEAPELLANNVNTWFNKYPATRMFRMLDGRNRACLSNSFRPLDNFDFGNVILDVCHSRKLEIASCEITEKRLYIKAMDTSEFEVPVGYKMGDGSHRFFDTCVPAFIASNSEIGFGRLVLETGIYTKRCTNLAWWSDGGFKKTHLGSRHRVVAETGVENIDHLLSDRTKQKSDEALWLQLRDVLGAAFDAKRIEKRAEQLAATSENKINAGAIPAVMKIVGDRFGLNEREGASVLEHLIAGGNLTQYGLHAAITRSAQDSADYDRATELEYLGGKIVELPRTEWETLIAA